MHENRPTSLPDHRSRSRRVSRVCLAGFAFASLLLPTVGFAGGTPDPGSSPLLEDGGDADALPDNENQLLGLLGADRGFGFGDYVSDALSGLQSTLGAGGRYRFLIEVPPGQVNLTVEIFDADTGAGDVAGTEEHDADDETPWDTTTTYELRDPSGSAVASISLPPQDCDPVTVGMQTSCNNAWSSLGLFSVATPAPGHWELSVSVPDLGGNEDDANSYGVRAHDGDATAGGTEYNVYADTYVGLGQVYGSSIGPFPALSRTHDFAPLVAGGCSCDANDWDTDADGDESTLFTPPRPPAGTPPSFGPTPSSVNASWGQQVISGFATDDDATNYGLWDLRWTTGSFNFLTFYIADDSAADPALPPAPPGAGASPDAQPEPGAIRLYLPADGSRFFGERGGPDDAVLFPTKPWVGQSWALVAGESGPAVGLTSRIEVTITVDNPTAFPIQFDATTGGSEVVTAVVPTNGGQSTYVAGSATITGGTSTATTESGAGPWTLTFAPGVVAAGSTATLTYRIDLAPSSLGVLDVTGTGTGTGTRGRFVDETCADAAGGPSACSATALSTATFEVGPLCPLRAPVTAAVGVAQRVASGPTDNMDGTFTVGLELVVENLGSDPLPTVQVTSDLAGAFPAPATVTAGPVAVDNAGGGMLAANPGFDGGGDPNLLAGGSGLPIGTTAVITVPVTFDPNGLPGPFFSQAFASGETAGGTEATDASDDGADPDPNGNGNANEAGENDPTPIVVPEAPSIAVAKTAGAVTDAPTPGRFDVTFSIVATNDGNVDLDQVQITDDLAAAFPAPATVLSASALCTAGSCGTVTLDFTGPADTTLLDPTSSTLAVGASVTLELTVRFQPNGTPGPFTNQAVGAGDSPLDAPTTDSDTADAAVPEAPSIGVAKTSGAVTDAPTPGRFDVTFSIVATNDGNVDLDQVQVTDDLAAAFPAPATVLSASALCTAGSCGSVTLDFTGPADTTLLDPTSSALAVGASVTLELTVRFQPNEAPGPFTNQAAGAGDSPLDTTVQDSDTADAAAPENPSVTVAKTLADLVDLLDGTFTATFDVDVSNTGNVDLLDVRVVDDLSAAFPPPVVLVSVTPAAGGAFLAANPSFDGDTDTDLLAPGPNALPAGEVDAFSFSVTFDPAGDLGPYTNGVDASASSPQSSDVQDDDTATVLVPGTPVIGVAKALVGAPVPHLDGTFTVSFLVTVDNLGDVDLTDVQVTDDLALTFPAPASVVSVTPPVTAIAAGAGHLDANVVYDGVGDIDLLLAATSILEAGASGEIAFDVTFDPATEILFLNSATATADSIDGPTADTSDDGTDPDADGDGNPDEGDPTPIEIRIVVPVEIPALGGWSLGGTALLLALFGMGRLRRRAY